MTDKPAGSRKLTFSADNRLASVFDIPRLSLKKGERARIAMLENDASFMLRHWVDGIGYIECKGGFEQIKDLGTDPEHCALCKIASPVRDSACSMPKRSFAAPIMQYLTDSRLKPMEPIAAQMKLWVFGEDKFSVLCNRADERGDLRQYDIIITCQEEQFQRFDIDIAQTAFWLKDDETRKRIAELYKEERPADPDLMRVLGRSLDEAQLRDIAGRVQTGADVGVALSAVSSNQADSSFPEVELDEEAIVPAGDIDFDSLLSTD